MARLLASRATSLPGPLAGTRASRLDVERRLITTAGSHRISGQGTCFTCGRLFLHLLVAQEGDRWIKKVTESHLAQPLSERTSPSCRRQTHTHDRHRGQVTSPVLSLSLRGGCCGGTCNTRSWLVTVPVYKSAAMIALTRVAASPWPMR